MKKKLRMETNEAIQVLDENVEKEWKKMQQIAQEKKKLKEIYDLFFSRIF